MSRECIWCRPPGAVLTHRDGGTGRQKDKDQGLRGTGLNLRGVRWTVLTAESCWFIVWWRPGWHSRCFTEPIHIFLPSTSPLPISTPRKVILLCSSQHHFWAQGCSMTVNKSVQQGCGQALAALTWPAESPGSPGGRAALLEEAHVWYSSPLILTESSAKVDSIMWVIDFVFGIPTREEFPPKTWCSEEPTVSLKPFCRNQVNLYSCHNLQSSTTMICRGWYHTSVIKSMPRGINLSHFKTIKGLCSLFPKIIKNIIWQ